jgi:UDP-glucuronate 4-epimerase
VVDSFDEFYDPAIKRANLQAVQECDRFELYPVDIRDQSRLEQAFGAASPEAVVHMAARAGVRPSLADPHLYESINVAGTISVLDLCRRFGVERMVFASSSSVYGENHKVPFHEDDRVDTPISPYAVTKRAGELLCHSYHHLYGLNVFCVRIFTAHGPRCRPDLALAKFVRLIDADEPVPVYGDGTTSRDYTYVGDIADGVVQALCNCAGWRIYNLGSGRPIKLSDMIDTIGRAMGKPARIKSMDKQPGDVTITWADISRASQELGYAPSVSLAEGANQYVQWYRRVLSLA